MIPTHIDSTVDSAPNQVAGNMNEQMVDSDVEASESWEFATHLLREWKAEFNTSELNTAIFFLEECLRAHPRPDLQRFDIVVHLINARLTRFAYTSEKRDLHGLASDVGQLADAVDDLAKCNLDISTADEDLDRASEILTEFRRSGNLATLETVIFLHHHALSLWRTTSATRWMPLNGLCDALSLRLLLTLDKAYITEYTAMAQALYALKPSYHHHYLIALALPSAIDGEYIPWDQSLGIRARTINADLAFYPLWNDGVVLARSGNFDAAIIKFMDVDDLIAYYNPQRPNFLATWAVALIERFSANSQRADLDDSITQYRRALAFPKWEGGVVHLEGLAAALLSRFQLTGRESDLDEAIVLHREALPQITEPVYRRRALLGFATTLGQRCTLTLHLADVEDVIVLLRELLCDGALDAGEKGQCLAIWANMLEVRYWHLWDDADLQTSIGYREDALAVLPPLDINRCAVLMGLANGLTVRFLQHVNPDDIHDAVRLTRQALDSWPEGRHQKDTCIANMATILHERYNFLGDVADLDESIELHSAALELRPVPHSARPESLNNLSNALTARFVLYRRTADREKAAEMYREALILFDQSSSPHVRNFGQNNLSSLLTIRFEELDMLADLDITEAVKLAYTALGARPQKHPRRVTAVGNLASALYMRFRMEGDITDLNEAIDHLQAALVDHKGINRPLLLTRLVNYLLERHFTTGHKDDLEAVITVCDGITEETEQFQNSAQGQSTLMYLNNARAAAFFSSYRMNGDPLLLERSIWLTRLVLNSLPKEHLAYWTAHVSLGRALVEMYNLTKETIHIDEAITSFQIAAENTVVPLHERLGVARDWASNTEYSRPTSALAAYEYAIGLLPQLAMAGHDLRGRNRSLLPSRSSGQAIDGLGSRAATCAIHRGQLWKAVELLETARSVFWSQALQLRPPLEEVRRINPSMATRLAAIADQLEKGAMRDTSRHLLASGSTELWRMEEETSRYRKLNEEWLKTIDTIRELPGFHNFLRPRPIAELRNAARYGPVVILNTSKKGCHALIVTLHRDVQCVPLSEMRPDAVTNLAKVVRAITQGRLVDFNLLRAVAPESNVRLKANREGNMDLNDAFGLVLRQLWTWVVKPVLDALKIKRTEVPSRLWWCPTGAFAFLPMHAAGDYEPDGDCISNYVISSYTPNLTLLLRPFSSTKKPCKMTAIIQPNTLGYGALPSTITELKKIKSRVPNAWLNTLGDRDGSPADISTVLTHLGSSQIVHFACHGHQDNFDPLESALLLDQGERLKMSQIMQTRPIDGSNKAMSLVFLAACETAQGEDAQPDEAMHVAATLLFVGFGGVVATMWTMQDADGPAITDMFYEQLFKDSAPNGTVPDLRNAASALHMAVQRLRMAGNVPFIRWVPFVHFGL